MRRQRSFPVTLFVFLRGKEMKHYLNVCDINGAEIEPVDIITFGSPCQDLSVAGKRAGLKHEDMGDEETTRSGLFIEAVRIIREMREATDGRQPRFALWENVPGAFSSNNGEDFRVVLEELAKTADKTVYVPMPEKGKWSYAGYMEGDDWSIAWRVLDAQYHGVPQRRRRILLVADFADKCAGEILFKCEGLRGYPAEGVEEGQAASSDASVSIGSNDCDEQCKDGNLLRAMPLENHPADSRVRIDDSGKIQTLTNRMGTGGGNVPMVMEAVGVDLYNQAVTGDKSKPMTAAATDSDHVPCVIEPTVALEGNGSRPSHKGDGFRESETMYTLNAVEQHAVAYGICSYDSNSMKSSNPHSGIYEADTSRTLDLNGGDPACNQGGMAVVEPIAVATQQGGAEIRDDGICPTITASAGMSGNNQPYIVSEDKAYTLKIRGGVDVDSSGKRAGKGPLIQTEMSGTIGVSQDQYLFQPTDNAEAVNWDGKQIVGTLTAQNAGGNQRMPDKDNFTCVLEPVKPIALETYHCETEEEMIGALKARDYKDPTCVVLPDTNSSDNKTRYIVRRLTPTECARLQGFPDDWGQITPKTDMTDEEVEFWRKVFITHQTVVNGKLPEEVQHRVATKEQVIKWYNGLHTDGAEYKMWGNGVALPCVRVPIHGMAKLGAKTMGSLFDGSGGFPLAGVLDGIEPVWCSEIEPYPIAVTTERFPEKSEG